jgi:H+/Cl- antiporter ClcA
VSEPTPKSVPETASELWALTKDYARQETLDPFKDLLRYVGFGVGAAVVGGIGFVMLLLAVLRFLQTETGERFAGNGSIWPYVIVIVVAIVAVVIAYLLIKRKPKRNR